jgi:hypothetical protein
MPWNAGRLWKLVDIARAIQNSFPLIEMTARKDTPKTTFNYFVGGVIVPRKIDFKTRLNKIK